MKMTSLSPNLMVKNVFETVQYYIRVLWFDCLMAVDYNQHTDFILEDSLEYAFAIVKKWDVEIMFQAEDSLKQELPGLWKSYDQSSVALYIKMEWIEEYYKTIKLNVKLEQSLKKTWYGSEEFYIRDLNGYIIGFAEMQKTQKKNFI